MGYAENLEWAVVEVHRQQYPVDFGRSFHKGMPRIPTMEVVEMVQRSLGFDLVRGMGTVEHTRSLVYRPILVVGIHQTRLLLVDLVAGSLRDHLA